MEDLFGICPVVTAQKVLSGKWTLIIMHKLSARPMRFNELQRSLGSLTQATLSKQLKRMEKDGLILRKIYGQIPPKVEYSLSDLGREFSPVSSALEAWGNKYIETVIKRDEQSESH